MTIPEDIRANIPGPEVTLGNMHVELVSSEGQPTTCKVWVNHVLKFSGSSPAGFDEMKKLVEYALHLRMYGENAPGGDETWAKWESMAERALREDSKRPHNPDLEAPHSRACKFLNHPHGTECSLNCPTCGGMPLGRQ